jgi:hypothetical protein
MRPTMKSRESLAFSQQCDEIIFGLAQQCQPPSILVTAPKLRSMIPPLRKLQRRPPAADPFVPFAQSTTESA